MVKTEIIVVKTTIFLLPRDVTLFGNRLHLIITFVQCVFNNFMFRMLGGITCILNGSKLLTTFYIFDGGVILMIDIDL